MSELENRLSAVLSDPAELRRLSEMASRLMGGGAPEPPKEEAPKPPAGDRGKKLLEALGPYLDEERRGRLKRALRLASTAKLAASVLGRTGGDHGV